MAGPRRGLLLLAVIVIATLIGAVELDDPWRALLIAAGVALAIAEATAVGHRVADGLLWLAAQLLPADGRSAYLQMWRADLVESVDGQGPVSFALDVLLSGPLTAVTMRQSSQSKPIDSRNLLGAFWLTIVIEFYLPLGCGCALLFVPGAPRSSGMALLLATWSWNILLDVSRRRLFIQLGAIALAVTSIQLPNYSAQGYAGWASACLLAMLALRPRFGWSVPRTALLTVVTAVPVSLFGAFRWDYFGRDVAESIICLVIAPLYVMLGRGLAVLACEAHVSRTLRAIAVPYLLVASTLLAGAVLGSIGWMCAGSLPFLLLGAVIELRRPVLAVQSPAEETAADSVAPLA
ncbi:MAG TPA: hypothetical protein VFU36_15635 [Jatrophihabitans sp.]|nr:hypothetical protein [Jatrophihabitans sp.]